MNSPVRRDLQQVNRSIDQFIGQLAQSFQPIETKTLAVALRALAQGQELSESTDSIRDRLQPLVKVIQNPEQFQKELPTQTKDFLQLFKNRLSQKADELERLPQNSESLEKDKKAARLHALELVKKDGLSLKNLSEAHRNDSGIVLAAVKQNGLALQFAGKSVNPAMKSVILLEALEQNGLALQFLSPEERDTFWIVYEAVKQNPKAAQFASQNLQNDARIQKKLAAAASQPTGLSQATASKATPNERSLLTIGKGIIQHIREVILLLSNKIRERLLPPPKPSSKPVATKKKWGAATAQPSPHIESLVKEGVIPADIAQNLSMKSNRYGISALTIFSNKTVEFLLHAPSSEFTADDAMTLTREELLYLTHHHSEIAAVAQKGAEWSEMRRALWLEMLSSRDATLKQAPDAICDDRLVVSTAVLQDYRSLAFASERLKDDPEVLLLAVGNYHPEAMLLCNKMLRSNEQLMLFIMNMLQFDAYKAASFAASELLNSPDFMLQAIRIDYRSAQFASDALKNNPQFMSEAIRIDYRTAEFCSDALKNDSSFMLAAIKIHAKAKAFASKRLQKQPLFAVRSRLGKFKKS